MASTIPRYIVENEGPNSDAVKTTFVGAHQICTEQNIKNIHVVIPAKKLFEGTVVAAFLGEIATRALLKGETVTLGEKVTMTLSSITSFQRFGSYGLIVVVYLPLSDMDKIDAVSSQGILYLPWLADEGKKWSATWKPKVVGSSTWNVSQSTVPHEVEEELLRLTHTVNLGTALTHPSDKRSAQEMFKRIKGKGLQINPESIRSWALRNNWRPDGANDLKKLAEKSLKR